MNVQCSLCGGENKIHPGQEMLFCEYCGSSLAVEKQDGPEHLILPHERNDKVAGEALRSLLTEKKLARPKDMKIEFSYIPFVMIENDRGKMQTMPAPGAPSWAMPIPFPPAGNYSFFDEALTSDEKFHPVKETPADAHKTLHLPVYRISYRAVGRKFRALVIGGSLLVLAKGLPHGMPAPLSIPNMIAAGSIFTGLLMAGRFMSGWSSRIGLIIIVSTIAYAIFSIRERVMGNE
ncbi:MAG: hypothetical protein KAV42_05865 [Candidatus Krumholzibacteria bacterium]|nr:hypothetical protein [Candidatus Krumholzibacteria bacterium]